MTYNVQSYYTQNNRTYAKSTGCKSLYEAIDKARRWSYAYSCTVYCGTTPLFTYRNGVMV